jgi:hypothetical protein
MSLTITAMRQPSRLFSMWLSRVVLPAPRKPESTVTGNGPLAPASRRRSPASRTAVYGVGMFVIGLTLRQTNMMAAGRAVALRLAGLTLTLASPSGV